MALKNEEKRSVNIKVPWKKTVRNMWLQRCYRYWAKMIDVLLVLKNVLLCIITNQTSGGRG